MSFYRTHSQEPGAEPISYQRILCDRTLYVGNVSQECTQADLIAHLSPYGTVLACELAELEEVATPGTAPKLDLAAGGVEEARHQGYAQVKMASAAEASRVVQECDGIELQGMPLSIELSTEPRRVQDLLPQWPVQDSETGALDTINIPVLRIHCRFNIRLRASLLTYPGIELLFDGASEWLALQGSEPVQYVMDKIMACKVRKVGSTEAPVSLEEYGLKDINIDLTLNEHVLDREMSVWQACKMYACEADEHFSAMRQPIHLMVTMDAAERFVLGCLFDNFILTVMG